MAYTYNIVNRRGGKRDWWIYKGSDSEAGSVLASYMSHALWNTTVSAAVSWDDGSIQDGAVTSPSWLEKTMKYFFQGGAFVGPYLLRANDHNVITPGDLQHGVVSVEQALSQLLASLSGSSPQSTQSMSDDAGVRQTVTKVGAIILTAFSAACSALGPAGSIGAGLGSFGGSLLLMGLDATGEDAPPPPGVGEIQKALTDVVQEQAARDDANLFMASYTSLQRQASDLSSYVPNRKSGGPDRWKQSAPIPDHLATDLEHFVHGALATNNLGSFATRLSYEIGSPDTAKYIIPELMVGIGVYLNLCRLHIASIYVPERAKNSSATVPVSVIQDLLDDLNRMSVGLKAARDKFQEFRGQKVNSTGLSGTPEAIAPIMQVSEYYLGDPYAVPDAGYAKSCPGGSTYLKKSYPQQEDAVDTALQQLASTADSLLQDINLVNKGSWPNHLINL